MNALKSQSFPDIIDPNSCDVDNDFEELSKLLYRWDLRTTLVGTKLKNKTPLARWIESYTGGI